MKNLLYFLFFLPVFLFAQPRYGVEGIPMCWTSSGVDSNIIRYVLVSSTGKPVKTIAFENAAGQVINVAGGYLKYGYCDCGGSGSGGDGIYGGSGVLPNDTVIVQNTQGLKFVQPGTNNGLLITTKANGAVGIALDPILTDSIRQGLVWNMGADSAAVGVDKDGNLQLLSNNWVVLGNDQAKIFIRKDDAGIGIKHGNSIYYLAETQPSGPNQIMVWDNNTIGRFESLDAIIDSRAKKDTAIAVGSGENYIVDFSLTNPADTFNNVYLIATGGANAAQVVFLGAPFPYEDWKGVVYHAVADSGDVRLFIPTWGALSNSRSLYTLKKGQRAEIRALEFNGLAFWKVEIVLPDAPVAALPTGTARTIPFFNNAGALVYNTFFRLDTTTTSGAQAKYRLLINNPSGTVGEGDSYSALSVRAGDGPTTEAILNVGDQSLTMGTVGYNSAFQLYRSRGTFDAKSNLQNGDNIGSYAWRGQANGGSRALGAVSLTYTGDGTTYRTQMLGQTSTALGQNISGWKLDDQSRFWLGAGADDYHFPIVAPSYVTGATSVLTWTGTGSSATSDFVRTQIGSFSGTTDGSGDLLITLTTAMPDATYLAGPVSETPGLAAGTAHTKTTTSFKARYYNPLTGGACAGCVVVCGFKLEDY